MKQNNTILQGNEITLQNEKKKSPFLYISQKNNKYT